MALLMSHTFRQSIPSIFTASKPTWPDPEQSIGRECSKISGLSCWEVTGPALEIMNKLSIPIKEMLDNHQEILEQGELKPRAVSFHMWMIGSAVSAASPTIVFSSKSSRQRTFAKVLLKESKLLDNYPGIRIKTLDKAPAIYQAADSNLDIDNEEVSNDGIYMVDDSRGVCGSLVAFGNSKLATMGGVILIDNVHYGMSAQHARFNYIRERQCLTSEPVDAPCFDDDSDSEYCDLIEATSKGSISSASDHGYDTESLTSAGIPTDDIFEPPYASSSVDQAGLETEEMINTQQDRYSCGQRIADISANYIQTDLDYELFRLDDPRFHNDNAISLPTMQESAQMLRPGNPARMPLDAAVWVVTGTTGSVRGTMTSTAHYIKMEGSRTFQEMWAVRLDRETRPGDCGAWVIDALTGSIYGHIIAGDPNSSMAYIIPAYKVFDDIENRFGVPPRLPSETAPDPIQNRIGRSSEPTQNYTTAPRSFAAVIKFDNSQQYNRARPRVDFMSFRVSLLHLSILAMTASRAAKAAALGQRTRCHRSGTSGSQLLAFHTHEGHLKQAQILQNSCSQAILVTPRRRIRIPARALDPPRDSVFLIDNSYSTNRAARLADAIASLEDLIASLGDPASCLTEFNEDAKAQSSRFDDLLRRRRLNECRAACGDSLGKLQQHGASLGNNYYRRLPIASMGEPNLHVLSDHFPAGANDPEEFWSMLSEGRSAWSEIPSDRFNSKAVYHPSPDVNGTTNHQGGHFLTQDKPAFDASFFEITRSKWHRLHRLHLKTAYEALEKAGMLRSERRRGLFLWKSRDMFLVRAVDLKRHSPHHIHSAITVEAPFSLIAQGIASNNAQVMRHGNLEICCPGIDMILVTQIQNNDGYKSQLIASFPRLSRAFSGLYGEQSSSVDYGSDARVLESIRLLFALASLSLPASFDNVGFEVCFWDIVFEAPNGRGVQRGL